MSMTLPQPRRLAPAFADLAAGTLAREVVLVAGGVALLAASARIAIPLPFTPVPITGQTFAVLLLGAGYGLKRAVGTMLCYLLVGMAGAPVFTVNPATGQARNGWEMLHAATAGYVVGMLAAIALLGWLSHRSWDRAVPSSIAQMVLASGVIYLFGLPWLAYAANLSASDALVKGLLPFLIGDAIKLGIAALVLPTLWRMVGSQRGRETGGS